MKVVRIQNNELLRKIETLSDSSVAVGFFPQAVYPDGTPVAAIASIHEYGAVINKAAGQVTLYRSIDKEGEFKHGGRFVKKRKANFSSTHNVPAHQVRIPCRSFMRTTAHEQENNWVKTCANLLRSGNPIEIVMNTMGSLIAGDIRDKIRSIASAGGNAPSTIRRKGFDRPLIDTGRMLRSVSFETGGAA